MYYKTVWGDLMEDISSEYKASSCSTVCPPLMVVMMILMSDRKDVGLEVSKQFNKGLVKSQV